MISSLLKMGENLWHFLPIASLLTLCLTGYGATPESSDLYAAADQLADWEAIRKEVKGELERIIRAQTERLNHLESVYRNFLLDQQTNDQNSVFSRVAQETSSPFNPVNTFVQLRRLMRVVDELEYFNLDSYQEEEFQGLSKGEKSSVSSTIPTEKDFEACGRALIRLQLLYDLNVSQIVRGNLSWEESVHRESVDNPRVMHSEDCLELGKLAFRSEIYPLAVVWFEEAIKSYISENRNEEDIQLDILEHLAFSAYKNRQLNYAVNVTRLWLEKDPTNDRAIHNMEYFQEELELYGEFEKLNETQTAVEESNTYDPIDTSKYQVEKDKLMSSLCKRSETMPSHNLTCSRYDLMPSKYGPLFNMKVETLSHSPRVIRIHEFLTTREASILRQAALPMLQRSTITSTQGLIHSEYRIAKTAWLSPDEHTIVKRIQDRISNTLSLSLQDAEPLQVVNYGVGGFYGPHLDCGRTTEQERIESKVSEDFSVKNERMVTVLMYLNKVEVGGGTVFPRLNLTVVPLERSTVIWYNQHESGYSDSQTLHLACPVLLGTKWIATEWIRERSNIFKSNRKTIIDAKVMGAS